MGLAQPNMGTLSDVLTQGKYGKFIVAQRGKVQEILGVG